MTDSNAGYVTSFPLESAKGGSLPDGSINLGQTGSQEPIEERCQYVYNEESSVFVTGWLYRSAGSRTSLRWNLEEILPLSLNIPDEVIINGYKYSKGELKLQSGASSLYTICRDKI